MQQSAAATSHSAVVVATLRVHVTWHLSPYAPFRRRRCSMLKNIDMVCALKTSHQSLGLDVAFNIETFHKAALHACSTPSKHPPAPLQVPACSLINIHRTLSMQVYLHWCLQASQCLRSPSIHTSIKQPPALQTESYSCCHDATHADAVEQNSSARLSQYASTQCRASTLRTKGHKLLLSETQRTETSHALQQQHQRLCQDRLAFAS